MASQADAISEQKLMDSFAGISAGVMQSSQRVSDSLHQLRSQLQALQNGASSLSLGVRSAGLQHFQPVRPT